MGEHYTDTFYLDPRRLQSLMCDAPFIFEFPAIFLIVIACNSLQMQNFSFVCNTVCFG